MHPPPPPLKDGLLKTVFVAVLLSMVAVGPALAQYPPSPTPEPTSGDPGSQIIIDGGGSGGASGGGSASGIVPGQTITLRGSGYLPNSSVDIVLNSTPRHLGTVMTDAQGSFEITVTIPSDVEVGSHTLTLTGIDADGSPRTDSIPVQIAAAEGVVPVADPAAPPASGSAGGLANTGLQLTNGLAVIGVLLAGGGGMLLLARRRRRGMSVSEA